MTLYAKFLKLKENKYLLDKAGKHFIDSLAEGLGGLGDDMEDEDLDEYVSPKQAAVIGRMYDEIF